MSDSAPVTKGPRTRPDCGGPYCHSKAVKDFWPYCSRECRHNALKTNATAIEARIAAAARTVKFTLASEDLYRQRLSYETRFPGADL